MTKTQGKRTDPLYQAQDILSRRDHSTAEVQNKLKRKGFTTEQISVAIHWLQEKRLLDDARFAERYIANTLAAKAVGRRWLQNKLREKGVAAALVESALNTALTPEQEHTHAQRAAATWRRIHSREATDQGRLTRHLLSRGFSWEVVGDVVKNLEGA